MKMKMNIYQLQNAAKRLPRKAARCMKRLMDRRPDHCLTEAGVIFNKAMLAHCVEAQKELKKELLSRRIGLLGIRDARPLKLQRRFVQAA